MMKTTLKLICRGNRRPGPGMGGGQRPPAFHPGRYHHPHMVDIIHGRYHPHTVYIIYGRYHPHMVDIIQCTMQNL